jgi:hypothetical protein
MTRLLVVVAASLGMVIRNNQTMMIIRDNGLYVGTVEVTICTANEARGNVHTKVWDPSFSGCTHSENVGSFTTFRGLVKVDRVLRAGDRVCAVGFWGNSA